MYVNDGMGIHINNDFRHQNKIFKKSWKNSIHKGLL